MATMDLSWSDKLHNNYIKHTSCLWISDGR